MKQELLKIAEKYMLKDRALAHIDEYIQQCIENDREDGIDFLSGQEKSSLNYRFRSYEYQIGKYGNEAIITSISIYSDKCPYSKSIDAPVGKYQEYSSLEGEHLDEFISLDWSGIILDISFSIEEINAATPMKYYDTRASEYEFVSYINNIIMLTQAQHYSEAITFIKKAVTFLDNHPSLVKGTYLKSCLSLFTRIYHCFIDFKEWSEEYKKQLIEELRVINFAKRSIEVEGQLKSSNFFNGYDGEFYRWKYQNHIVLIEHHSKYIFSENKAEDYLQVMILLDEKYTPETLRLLQLKNIGKLGIESIQTKSYSILKCDLLTRVAYKNAKLEKLIETRLNLIKKYI